MTEKEPSKMQVRLPFYLALAMAVGMFIGFQLPRFSDDVVYSPAGSTSGGASTFDEIMGFIEERYVDTVDLQSVKEQALNQLLEKLDPHSVYISPDEMEAVAEDMEGNFTGIGIEFLLVEDTIQVVTPLAGGPSEAAGILTGDKIITIGDSVVAGVKIDNGRIFKQLRGEKGSKVKIGILRGREKSLRDFTIARDVIPVHSVDVAMMLDERTGYLKINRFSATTYQEFMEKLRPLVEERGMKNLVLDLRGNPGGYLQEATDLLSQFFPEGKLLVYTKGRAEKRRDYKSNGRARFNIENVAVLVDEGSASASEIVAGALQDHDRGWIVGRRTYGKGLVQEQYPLQDGGGLRLTVARYFTPSGRCIQRDYKHTADYDHETERRLRDGELGDSTKIRIADSTEFYTGAGRKVFGGGGITPDVFIPLDTSFASDFYFDLRQHIAEFSARWMENHDRNGFTKDLPTFLQEFKVSDEMLDELVKFAEKQGVKPRTDLLPRCGRELKTQIRARFAKLFFKEEGQFAVFNEDDPAVAKALQMMRNGERVAQKK